MQFENRIARKPSLKMTDYELNKPGMREDEAGSDSLKHPSSRNHVTSGSGGPELRVWIQYHELACLTRVLAELWLHVDFGIQLYGIDYLGGNADVSF